MSDIIAAKAKRIVPSFMRVLRKLDDADSLVALLSSLEKDAPSNPSALSIEDCIRILDFPDTSTQYKNIKSVTGLTKREFLKRSVEAPTELTDDELDLLEDRYWLDISEEEIDSKCQVYVGISAIAPGVYEEFMARLENLRAPFYEENEVEAFKSAEREKALRLRDWLRNQPLSEERLTQVDNALSKAHPWVRRLWEEDGEHKLWGFPVFEDPHWASHHEEREDYRGRQENVLSYGRRATGYEDLCRLNWTMEDLEWPALDLKTSTSSDDEQFLKSINGLRDHFNEIRSRPTTDKHIEKHVQPSDPNRKWDSLSDGILQNVFLYVDQEVADSMYSRGWLRSPSEPPVFMKGYSEISARGRYPDVDQMWIWAIDPDYVPSLPSPSGYKGYLKVRLQQLVHNFYVARRWHADDFSMEDLWKLSQKAPDGAFVSFREEEIGMSDKSEIVGSAIRAQPMRVVYGPSYQPS